jgi:hypothetical protein
MNTAQLIEAIKASTKEQTVLVPGYTNFGKELTLSYIDADAFLAAVERLAEAENAASREARLEKFRSWGHDV